MNKKLFSAIDAGDARKVKKLIKAGADVNAKDKNGWPALYRAAWLDDVSESLTMAKLLLNSGADVNAKVSDAKVAVGPVSLHAAAWLGDVKMVKLLLAAGAKVNAKNHHGETPLHKATEQGRSIKVVRVTLAAGAKVNARTTFGTWAGCTPLYEAARFGDIKTARLLLKAGADVNAKDKSGCTPLHYAALYGYVKAAKLLIEFGAKTGIKDKQGMTAIDCMTVRALSSPEMAELLKEVIS